LNAYGTTSDNSLVFGAQHTHRIDTLIFMPSELTFGAEYSYNDLLDQMLGYNKIISQKVNTKSAYLQNEWKNRKLSILIGGRLDKHSMVEYPIISPRVNLRYLINKSIIVRASYATGFRAPQAFDEDLHITAVNGGVSLIRIDTNLETEKSQSITGSLDFYRNFGKIETNLLIEGFYTRLDNVFVLEDIGEDANGNLILERRNGAGAVVKGLNIEGRIIPSRKTQLQLGVTLQRSLYTAYERWSDNENIKPQKRMFKSPNTYGFITFNYTPTDYLNLSLFGTYTGSMLVQHFKGFIPEDREVETQEFFDLSFRLAYDFNINESAKIQLNAGLRNILNSFQNDFDLGINRDAAFVYGPTLPRTAFFGVKLFI